MNTAAIATELEQLAERIARLRPVHSDAFYELRSQHAHDARAIAEWMRSGRKPVDLER